MPRIQTILFEIGVVFLLMVLLDSAYLYFAKPFYENQVITIQRVALQVKPLGAIVAYAAMAPALWYFVLNNPTATVYKDSLILAFAIFGTYNATSYAILKKYRLSLAALDTVWGLLMFSATSFLFMKWKYG